MHRSRMVSQVGFFYNKSILTADFIVIRCTAHRNDLDGGSGRRSRDHTELLVSELELGVLWDEYDLIGNIVACLFVMKLIP